jgi:glycosyltransferase involved in cell wall biosynthesis
MVRAFRDFVSQAGAQWELALVGSCERSVGGPEYLQAVRDAANGLPVTFAVNQSRETICRFLAEAKIFWHAAGLSLDELHRPDEAEHFGIATVEAMGASCVPVVIASGGQREIIQDGVNGYLATNLSEFVQKTVTLAQREEMLLAIGRNAKQRSLAFSRSAFDRQITQVVSQCLEPTSS